MIVLSGRRAVFAALFALCAATACAPPAGRYDAAARQAGLTEQIVRGQRFHHKIYRNANTVQDGLLHVFIEGDASVKQALRFSPPDPTPRRAMMLRMMQNGPAGAILLGRPCYQGLFAMDGCEIRHLGPERYSDEIVTSLLAALQDEMRHAAAGRAVLIGYSGGGTLAMLLAARLPATVALVTLAGNLDNRSLAAFHHSPALSGSLDPADLPPLPRNLLHLHFFGEKDAEVPVLLAQNTLARQRVTPVIMLGFDHACCWESLWPEINARLQNSLQPPAAYSGGNAG